MILGGSERMTSMEAFAQKPRTAETVRTSMAITTLFIMWDLMCASAWQSTC